MDFILATNVYEFEKVVTFGMSFQEECYEKIIDTDMTQDILLGYPKVHRKKSRMLTFISVTTSPVVTKDPQVFSELMTKR